MIFVTLLFIATIVVLLSYCLYLIHDARKNNTYQDKKKLISFFPSLVSTLGVLGTFIGIVIGLFYFDTSDIDSSITQLLDGLKTAFYTSIAGLLASIILNAVINNINDPSEEQAPSSEFLVLNNIYSLLQKQHENKDTACEYLKDLISVTDTLQNQILDSINEQNKIMNKGVMDLSSIRADTTTSKAKLDSIGGKIENGNKHLSALESTSNELLDAYSGQSSIMENQLEEIKTLSLTVRGEIASITDAMEAGNKLMISKFDEFSDLLRKNNVEALVEVMKKVTEEFNKQMKELINKLVQENFAELNKSVERLNNWQMEHKQMVADLTIKYQDMNVEFSNTSTTLNEVAINTENLTKSNGMLARLTKELQQVMIDDTKFTAITNQLCDTANKVKEGTDSFDSATRELNRWIKNHQDMSDAVRILIAKLEELGKIKDYGEEFWSETRKNMNEGVGIIATASKQLNSSIDGLNDEFYERLNTTLSSLDACIVALIKKSRE